MTEEIQQFYGLPHCTTCQKVQAQLESHGVKLKQYVNVKTDSVDRTTLESLAAKLGGVEKLFSKRALKYRAMNLHLRQTPLTEDEMLDLMASEYTFIRRPTLVTKSGQVYAAPSKKQLEALYNA